MSTIKFSYVFIVVVILFSTACKKEDNDPDPIDPPIGMLPDKLLYSANPNGHNELMKLEDGNTVVLLSDPSYDYWWAKVSPDKTKFLVYRSLVGTGENHDNYDNADLMLYDIDGSNEQLLIPKGTNGWESQGICRWNIDGTKILFGANQEVAMGIQWRLMIANADGSDPKIMSDRWIIDPNFSPDNTKVIFIGFPDNQLSFDVTQLELHAADYIAAEDTIVNIERLSFNETRDHDPSYSPNGDKIIFSGGNAEYTNVDLVVYDVIQSSEYDLLDDTGSNGGSMCWSNDGSAVYFHSLNLLAHPFRIKRIGLGDQSPQNVVVAPNNNFGIYHPEVY